MITQNYRSLLLLSGIVFLLAPSLPSQPTLRMPAPSASKRPVTVEDAIAFTRPAAPGSPSGQSIASFSPDGKRFVIVLRKGDVAANVNEYAIYLFHTATALANPRRAPVLTMRSSSNRPAFTQWQWLADSRRLLFIGETPGAVSQIYAFDTVTQRLTQLTHHATAITAYRTTGDGKHIVFLAEPRPPKPNVKPFSITDQRLDDLLKGETTLNPDRPDLFILTRGEHPFRITSQRVWMEDSLSLSPDGHFAVIGTQLAVTELSPEWALYQYPRYYKQATVPYFSVSYGSTPTAFTEYLLLNIETHTLSPIWKGPIIGMARMRWAPVGHTLIFKGAYLPLTDAAPFDREQRLNQTYNVEISASRKSWRVVTDHEWPFENTIQPLHVVLREDVNTPPRIYVETVDGRKNALLLDLNPQLDNLALGKVETISWMVHGIEVTGGLYYPPDYVQGRKYPLVIQTHGYVPAEFSMDGRSEWSSNFAARPLAAHGVLVLQAYAFKSTADHDAVAKDRSLGNTIEQSYVIFTNMAYDEAINSLAKRGLIDENDVGIAGFSRTVWFVAYALTHSTHHYRAAILTDGIDGGYFQYIAFRVNDLERDNGGLQPFSRQGLEQWLEASPGFNLDKVHTPVRLVALDLSGVLEAWEWFAGMQLQGKPVDFVAIPDGVHMLERPSDRKVAMQGVVDWFNFWLCGKVDPVPAKASQYEHWLKMQVMAGHELGY